MVVKLVENSLVLLPNSTAAMVKGTILYSSSGVCIRLLAIVYLYMYIPLVFTQKLLGLTIIVLQVLKG